MIDLEIKVLGVERVQAGLLNMPRRLRERLITAMTANVIEVGASAAAEAPVGATRRVQSGIRTTVTEERRGVVGRVIDDWYISRFVEGGVHAASMPVKAHVRRNESADVQAIGKRGQQLKRLAVMGYSAVKAYTRSVHIEANPFMRRAWASNQSSVQTRIAQAVKESADEANG